MNNKVIVIGCKAGGLGVIRSFASKPVDIIALSYDSFDYAHKSRYVSKWYDVPHPGMEQQKFVQFLIDKGPEWQGAMIFDTEDEVAVAISKHKKELSQYYKIVTAEWDMMRTFMEKKFAWELCLKSGVPHPANFLPKTLEEFNKVRNEVKLPCIFKPVRGYEFVEKFKRKNFEVYSLDQYDKYSELCVKENQEVMVQEIVPGSDSNIFKCMTYINSKREITGMFFYNKIRQNPPKFGVHRVSISAGKNPIVEDLFRKLLSNSNYTGFCTVEFKKDFRDGVFKFIEVNVRMPRMISISSAAGVNFPWIIYQDLVNDEQIKFNDYKENLYWIEINSDIFNTFFRFYKEKFNIVDYLKPYFSKNKTFAVFDTKDIAPYTYQTSKLPKVLFGKG